MQYTNAHDALVDLLRSPTYVEEPVEHTPTSEEWTAHMADIAARATASAENCVGNHNNSGASDSENNSTGANVAT